MRIENLLRYGYSKHTEKFKFDAQRLLLLVIFLSSLMEISSSQEICKANYTLVQKVGDISLPRNHAPVSRAVDLKFHPDKHDALPLARCRFVCSSAPPLWKNYTYNFISLSEFWLRCFTFLALILV